MKFIFSYKSENGLQRQFDTPQEESKGLKLDIAYALFTDKVKAASFVSMFQGMLGINYFTMKGCKETYCVNLPIKVSEENKEYCEKRKRIVLSIVNDALKKSASKN